MPTLALFSCPEPRADVGIRPYRLIYPFLDSPANSKTKNSNTRSGSS